MYIHVTSRELLVILLLLVLVMMTVRLMLGSVTESRLVPVTVDAVPPLLINTFLIQSIDMCQDRFF